MNHHMFVPIPAPSEFKYQIAFPCKKNRVADEYRSVQDDDKYYDDAIRCFRESTRCEPMYSKTVLEYRTVSCSKEPTEHYATLFGDTKRRELKINPPGVGCGWTSKRKASLRFCIGRPRVALAEGGLDSRQLEVLQDGDCLHVVAHGQEASPFLGRETKKGHWIHVTTLVDILIRNGLPRRNFCILLDACFGGGAFGLTLPDDPESIVASRVVAARAARVLSRRGYPGVKVGGYQGEVYFEGRQFAAQGWVVVKNQGQTTVVQRDRAFFDDYFSPTRQAYSPDQNRHAAWYGGTGLLRPIQDTVDILETWIPRGGEQGHAEVVKPFGSGEEARGRRAAWTLAMDAWQASRERAAGVPVWDWREERARGPREAFVEAAKGPTTG